MLGLTLVGHAEDIELNTAWPQQSWFDGANWAEGSAPTDGQSANTEVGNISFLIDIDNGGSGVNLPSSAVRIGRGTLLDSSGADDTFVADVIQFNGAGGASTVVNVPVIARTLRTNRHGPTLNAVWSASNIVAQSGHQDKWMINASPSVPVDHILLNENRGADGGTIDGFFATSVDMTVNTIDHVWLRLRVDDAAATLTVDTYNYTYYTNRASDNNDNPVVLNGNMVAANFNTIDILTATPVAQSPGTWGAIGSGADNEVTWITGSGILTVGASGPSSSPGTLIYGK